MKKLTIQEIDGSHLMLYKYIRGSHAYGLQTKNSDIDTAMVYIEPIEHIIDLGINYQEQVQDTKGDNVGYELNKFMRLLLTSNPTMLESLFIDDEFILYEHPIITEIKKHRDKFVTKACFKPFLGYSYEQINKCRGLNKRFLQEKIERKEPLDFAFTFRKQGSTKILNWLEHRGMKQKYCGLVNIPNMDCMYALFYDWGNHFLNEKITLDMLLSAKRNTNENETIELIHQLKHDETLSESKKKELEKRIEFIQLGNMARFISSFYNMEHDPYNENFAFWYESQKPLGYKGMTGEDHMSNELRLSSIEKDAVPLCHIHYDKDKYSSHCKDYRNQKEWEENRNPERYKENCGKMFDRKNVMHAVRLIHMGIEITKGEGFNVNRKNIDRDFLLKIRSGDTSYKEIIEYIENKRKEMYDLMEKSTLPEKIDVEFVNNLLLDIRKKQIKDNFVH